ncbi:MAG: T9SS type A sorting domain-containing protein [Bacteroidetes bacterium]|nr:T9SS type A sorting domain-containing protein [Bacteroidota bacterium]
MKLNAGRWGQCTKSPNGRTYFHYRDSTFLNSLIDENDSNVALEFNSISISPQKTLASLPNFNQSYFNTPSVDFAFNYDCTTNIISFEGRDTFYADSFNWRAQKAFGFTSYSSKNKNPKITFADTGIFDVAFIATKGSRSDTVSKRITIYPKIEKDFLGKDSMYKSDALFNLVLKTPLNMHCISWQDSSSSPTFTIDTTGVFSVTVTNKAFCTVSDTITITRCVNSLPKPILMRDKDTLKTLSSIADSFVWYRNGIIISITKDTFIELNDTGAYKISASKQGYCNNMSDAFNYPCLIGLIEPILYLSTDTIFVRHIEADSFVWYRNNIKFTFTIDSFILPSDTGTFKVDAYTDKFCHSTSKPLYVHCLDRLTTPDIYLSRDTLYAEVSQADSFLWYRNGKNIMTTKEAFIKISDTGTYYVEAVKKLNCKRRSSILLVSEIKTSLKSIIQNNIKIFPNPADETISIEIDEFAEFEIRLYDFEGRLQYEGNTSGVMTILKIEEFTQGLYLIELINNKTLYYYKILIR